VYQYKQPFRAGSTHVVLEPLDSIARLAALVPRPRLNLTSFHGVFAPNFKHRARIVPRRARGRVDSDKPLAPMTWAQRLKRVFASPFNGKRRQPANQMPLSSQVKIHHSLLEYEKEPSILQERFALMINPYSSINAPLRIWMIYQSVLNYENCITIISI
jgi:hypothetical protein